MTFCATRSTVSSVPGCVESIVLKLAHSSSGRRTGTMPFFMQLLKKMSPKLGARMLRKPASWKAYGAPSREEPQPKLVFATRIFAFPKTG